MYPFQVIADRICVNIAECYHGRVLKLSKASSIQQVCQSSVHFCWQILLVEHEKTEVGKLQIILSTAGFLECWIDQYTKLEWNDSELKKDTVHSLSGLMPFEQFAKVPIGSS